MLFSPVFVGLLLPLTALAGPVANPEPVANAEAIANPEGIPNLEERFTPKPCYLKTTTSVVRYRTCPKTSCEAVGEHPKGFSVKLKCIAYGTTVGGDK